MHRSVAVVLLLVVGAFSFELDLDKALFSRQTLLQSYEAHNARLRTTANNCPNAWQCTNTGGACGTVWSGTGAANTSFNLVACNGQDWCNIPAGASSGTCASDYATGVACSSNQQCKPTDTCSGGVCKTVTYTAGANSVCSAASQCVAGLQCVGQGSAAKCVTAVATNAACNTNLPCGDASSCINGTCVAWGTVPVNGVCTRIFDCTSGLYCNGTSFFGGGSGTCLSPLAATNIPCSTDSDCAASQGMCLCNADGSTRSCQGQYSMSDNFNSKIKSVVNCLWNNKCANMDACSSCSLNDVCTALDDELEAQDSFNFIPKCFVGGPCALAGASTLTFSLFTVAAAALLLF